VGLPFGLLGVDLVERRGLVRDRARVLMIAGNHVLPWSRSLAESLTFLRRALDAAEEVGDVTYAAYSFTHVITIRLASGDPLADVQREAERALAFARKTRFGGTARIFMALVGLIQSLRGLAPDFTCFEDGGALERELEGDPRLALPACWYWARKMQARFFDGDLASALEAEAKAAALLWTTATFFELHEFYFYGGARQGTGLRRASRGRASGAHGRARRLPRAARAVGRDLTRDVRPARVARRRRGRAP
jgi:hypothetical protein